MDKKDDDMNFCQITILTALCSLLFSPFVMVIGDLFIRLKYCAG